MIHIINNPIELVLQAVENVTHIECDLTYIPPELAAGNAGYTNYDEDGGVAIFINCEIPYIAVLEIIAHEAAHVAREKERDKKPEELTEEEQHDEEWDKIFNDIQQEYIKLCKDAGLIQADIVPESEAGEHE